MVAVAIFDGNLTAYYSVKVHIYASYGEMSLAAARFVIGYVQRKPNALLCFPSGDTPTGTCKYLADFANSGEADFSQCHFVGLDEWVGMDRNDAGSCQHYLYNHLFNPLNVRPDQITFFDAKAADPEKECGRINDFIGLRGPIDLMLVGVGLNGHIGLNEPGAPFDQYAHLAALDPITQTTAQKYFSRPILLTQGITLGIGHLLESSVAVILASGTKKAGIITQAIEGEITEKLPASIIQHHADGHIFLDQAAAANLTQMRDK